MLFEDIQQLKAKVKKKSSKKFLISPKYSVTKIYVESHVLNTEFENWKGNIRERDREGCLLFIIHETVESIFSCSNTQTHGDHDSGKTCSTSI